MPKNIFFSTEYTFTRPADTTAYAAGDLVANSTTAASVVPLSWSNIIPYDGLSRNASFRIIGARMRKSSTGLTTPSFRIHLFSATPTFVTSGDNSATSTCVATGAGSWIGSLSATFVLAFADGSSVHALPSENGAAFIPANLAGASASTIYGIIEATAAYAPASGETIGVRLIVEQYI